jgi:hypothetical protein
MSTGTTGAIRGGMAYVQAYLDDNPLTQGLANLQTKLKSWQAGLSKLAAGAYGGELPEPFAAIARFATSPAGAFSALLGAAKLTADAREEMLRMSETTGVAVDKLSALSYAARRAGISNEALASGLKKMQGKEFMAGMASSKGAGGLTQSVFGEMGKGDAADRLREFIKLAQNMPTEEKIGLARKMGLSELLPLINQGIDSLDAFTARAKQLGLVMGEEDAKAGKQFTLALGDLHDVVMNSVSAIGGALVPVITGLANLIVPVAVAVRDWIKQHQALTQAIFYGTGIIVGCGIAIKLLAIGFGLLGSVVTAVTFAVNLLLSPWEALAFAIAGLGGYLLYASGALDGFGKKLIGLARQTGETISAVTHAVAAGGLTEAWDVICTYFQLRWAQALDAIQTAWEDFTDWFSHSDIVSGAMTGAFGPVGGLMSNMAAQAANAAGQSGLQARRDEIQELQKKLSAAQAAANALKAPGLTGGGKGQQAATAMGTGEQRGTFSGAVAAMLGGGGVAEKQLEAAYDAVALQRQHIQLVEQGREDVKQIRDYLKSWGVVI